MVAPTNPEPVKATKDEEEYIDRALNAGVQLLEIVHVLVLYRITQSPNIPNPDYIQRQYTICKTEVQRLYKEGNSIVNPGIYIPKHAREDKE